MLHFHWSMSLKIEIFGGKAFFIYYFHLMYNLVFWTKIFPPPSPLFSPTT